MRRLLLMLICFLPLILSAQKAIIEGFVKDAASGEVIEYATVYVKGQTYAVETDIKGAYSISVPANEAFELLFSRIGYELGTYKRNSLAAKARIRVDIRLVPQNSDLEIIITENKLEASGMIQ